MLAVPRVTSFSSMLYFSNRRENNQRMEFATDEEATEFARELEKEEEKLQETN